MSVRKHPTKGDNGWWYIDYYPQGRKGGMKSIPFQGTEIAARQWESELRHEARPVVMAEVYPKFSRIIPDYLAEYKQDHLPAGVERTIWSLKRLLPHFGSLTFQAITPSAISSYKEKRLADGVAPNTINKELAALSSICKWAEEKAYCHTIKVKRFPPKLTKSRSPVVLSEDEVMRFIGQLKGDKVGYFSCLYYGGLRSSEARNLTAEKVFLDRGVMIVVGKGNKERVVPLVPQLVAILTEAMAAKPTGPLFELPGDLRETILWAAKRAGITKHISCHTFRHCFGTHATMAGVNLRSLQDIMGHSSSAITEMYSRLASNALCTEMNKFGDKLTQNQQDSN